MNNPNHPLHNLIKNSTNNSVYLSRRGSSIRPCIDEAIIDINNIWKKHIESCPPDQAQDLFNVIGGEYVGNVTVKKFQNKRMGLLYRHDTINDLLKINKSHQCLRNYIPQYINLLWKMTI